MILDNYTSLIRLDNEEKYFINETDITWPDDKGIKFKRNDNWKEDQWIDPEDGKKNNFFFLVFFYFKNILLFG